jgi:protein-glucosylgalactosylhydroxylysine glucosidase
VVNTPAVRVRRGACPQRSVSAAVRVPTHRKNATTNNLMRSTTFILFLTIIALHLHSQKIDREKLVRRHNPIVSKADPLAALTVGNGKFAFTVDATGLQTFPSYYQKGIPLGTQSEWGWHSFIDTASYKREEAMKIYHLNGRDIPYTVQWNSPERNKAATNWFRQNPHRLQLGTLGFELIKKDGSLATIEDIKDIKQELDLWTGQIKSYFTLEGVPVNVSTYCSGWKDLVSVSVKTPLLAEGRIKFHLRFPYPTGEWTDEGVNYTRPGKHQSHIETVMEGRAVISHQLDTTKYYVAFGWDHLANVYRKAEHEFEISPFTRSDSFYLSAYFTRVNEMGLADTYRNTELLSRKMWDWYWTGGGAIDFEGSTDPRAKELERRIILSQYLMRAQEAGDYPPQETGLTYNSWFGKPHLEMHWWHAVHYALWGRTEFLEPSLKWYHKVASKAAAIAKRQGFEGYRWQKMTDNNGDETPSSIGAFLIWQQPHLIYMAELCHRKDKTRRILNEYSALVFKTADFMASFAYYDQQKGQYVLGKGVIPAQERFKPEETFNPTYELVYWKWALETAQQWRERLGLKRNEKWDAVAKGLSPLPVQDKMYLATESATDSYTNPEYRTDHPSVLAALGVMPPTGQVNNTIMKNTFDWIWKNWAWKDTWGWDFPMTAMTATRLGMPDKAIDALLMGVQTNTYLVNGHNYQDDRLRIYMPGNGGLLAAIAMMCAGYDGNTVPDPGIPKDGKWKVRWEGLEKMP